MSEYYLIGSLRNDKIRSIANYFRSEGIDIFDDWHAAGPEADDYWQSYEKGRGNSFPMALKGYAAQHVYAFDRMHLDRCSGAILCLPAGRSGHLELGYIIGSKKPGYILLEDEPDRYDVMYNFATGVYYKKEEIVKAINEWQETQTNFHSGAA